MQIGKFDKICIVQPWEDITKIHYSGDIQRT